MSSVGTDGDTSSAPDHRTPHATRPMAAHKDFPYASFTTHAAATKQ